MSVRPDLVGSGARRTALAATGIVGVAYVVIAIAVLLIVTQNLTSSIDSTISKGLSTLAAERATGRPFGGPPGVSQFDAPVLWWMYHPDGNYADSSPVAKANNLALPVSPTSIHGPQDIVISGTDFRVAGGPVGDDWAVVGQSLTSVTEARSSLMLAELIIGPVLLVIVFLGALAIGRRVASPIEQARRRQVDFTANASHELRTPLAVIQAQSSLALAQPREAEWYRRAFERVDRESQRMRHLVDDLLWLARMETTPHTAGMEPVDVAVMARNAVDRFVAVAEAQHQQFGLRTHGESAVITASPEWLDHLIGVLIDNACKYTPPDGSISVTVSAEGNTVRLTVDDSGPGIPEAARGRIFDRFQRASEQPGGSGLGLAIANAVVRATNGKWQVGTSPQGGASMAVTWPRQLARAATRRAAASRETPPLASLDV